MSEPPPDQQGFTLVEMLVALAVFSLAALALLRLSARNLAVEAITDPSPPAFGSTSGTLENAGGSWLWSRRTSRSPEPLIQQIEIQVSGDRGPMASLTVFRRIDG
jgi:general secretion pathway protein I